jgi:PAS domain S-box-containing protein
MENTIDQLIMWSKDLRVLYVEDDISLREEVSIFLSDIFKVVDLAENGKEGLEKLAQSSYHIVISDIRMPVMDGIEMIEKIKELYPEQAVLVTSAHNEIEYLVKLINLGVDNFITKPLRSEQIFKVLHKIVEQVHHKKELLRYREDLELANAKLKRLTDVQSKTLDLKSSLLKSYQEALDKACIVSITDTQGIIKDVNDNFCKATGYTQEDVIGKKHSIISSPLTDKAIFKDLWECITSKKMWQGYIINQTKSFTPLYHYTTIVPILNNKGDIVEFVGIIQDLSELHAYQEKQALKDIDHALQLKSDALIKQMPFPSALMRSDFILGSYNNAFEMLLVHHSNETLLGKLSAELLSLKELLNFEEMDYFENVDSILSQWPYAGDITCKGIILSLNGPKEVLFKISPFSSEFYLVCIIQQEDFELCCQVLER